MRPHGDRSRDMHDRRRRSRTPERYRDRGGEYGDRYRHGDGDRPYRDRPRRTSRGEDMFKGSLSEGQTMNQQHSDEEEV